MPSEKLIIGSHAMRHHFPDFKRVPNDIDYISKEKKKPTRTEEHIWVNSFQFILDNNKDPEFIDPELLITLKTSHFGWNLKWEKTAFDILFLKSKGYSADYNLYKILVKDWTKVHGKNGQL